MGTIAANTKAAALSKLRQQKLIPTAVKEKGRELAFPKFGRGVSSKELAIFTRQFSVMIDAGLPLTQCLDILGSQQTNTKFQGVLFQVRDRVEAGSSLSDALRDHPKVFSDLFCHMIEAGEEGGILDTILRRLAEYIEKAMKLKGALRSASVYPSVVISIAIIVVAIILIYVIPVFSEMFAGLGATLPLPTRLTITASNFLARWGWIVLIGLIGGVFGLRQYHKTYKGKRVVDGLFLKIPILGKLFRKIAIARFCRTLGTLTSSGVPIIEALEITARTAGNSVIHDAIMVARKSIEGGAGISDPLAETQQFPPMVTQMISVGEETGALDTMLHKIAQFFEDEVDEAVENLMSMLEPVMIVFLGGVIGGIVVSMYLPMFTLISQIG